MVSVTGADAVSSSENACKNPSAEAKLRQREIALLGPKHARDHAIARIRQCAIASGAAKVAHPDPTMLDRYKSLGSDAVGQWSNPLVIPVVGIASMLLNTGKVLFWSYNPPDYLNPDASNTGVAYVWDPVTQTGHSITPPENIWCGGQTILNDGRVYVAGGNLRYPDPNAAPGQTGWEGALTDYTFDPNTETWTRQPDMSTGRWYPTVTQLADNSVVIASGYDETGTQTTTQIVEQFVPSIDVNGVGTVNAVSMHDPTDLYPFQYLTQSGQMLQAGPDSTNTSLLTAGIWSWTNIPNMNSSHFGFGNGIIYTDASVTPISQVVVIAGGLSDTGTISNNEWLDLNNTNAGWNQFPQWSQTRHNSNTVILPDGTLFTVGGNDAVTTYDNPLFESELYNKPANDPTGSWVPASPNTIQAAYHSSAILLPDATVLLSQDDMDPSQASSHQVEIYSPPYLFNGSRPQIVATPNTLSLGQSFTVTPDSPNISSVALVAPSAVTHGNDMHQRYIRLASQVDDSGNLQVTLPSSSAVIPPGYYMLFIVDNNGTPSVATFVHVSS
jgi:hypothetical protein